MRHNKRDSKGRFVSGKSKCCCECSKEKKQEPEVYYPQEVFNFLNAAVRAAQDITMTVKVDPEKIADTSVNFEIMPNELAEDLKAVGVETMMDMAGYVITAREVVNDLIESFGKQITHVVKG